MPKNASKLLEKMRNSPFNWKRNDLISLYEGYGFVVDTKGANHDKIWHPKHPQLVTFLPRHNKLGVYLVKQAVVLVDQCVAIESREDNQDE